MSATSSVWHCEECGDDYDLPERPPLLVEGKKVCGLCACVQCQKRLAQYWPGVCSLACWQDFCEETGLDPIKDSLAGMGFVAIDSPQGKEILEHLFEGNPEQ